MRITTLRKQVIYLLTCVVCMFFTMTTYCSTSIPSTIINFDLGAPWDCKADGMSWICSQRGISSKIVVVTIKDRNGRESLNQMQTELKKRKVFNIGARTIVGVPVETKMVTLDSHRWVYSLHKGSELPQFVTRYLATVKSKKAILISYSVHEKIEGESKTEFEKLKKKIKITTAE